VKRNATVQARPGKSISKKEKAYFDRLRAFADELRSQGVERDEVMYRNLKAWTRATRARRTRGSVKRST
jgi:hypothetical protein